MLNLYQKSVRNTNLIIAILTFLTCIGCNGQVKQKENLPSKPALNTETEKTVENRDNKNLNQYKDDKKEGLWRTYYQNGQLKSEGSYKSDLKDGLHKEWENNGILSLEGFYTKGKANGLMKWYHEKGHLAAEGNMMDDKRVGKWTICDIEEDGFCIEAHFKDGKRDGIWKIYHDHANDKLWKEQTFKEDKMVSEKCWDEKGKEIACE